MNIKLSDEECSRWICEKLEPMPATTSVPEQPSSLGFWRSVYHHDAYRGSTDWQPRDMVNDPAMTVMLIQQLLGGRDYEWIISQDAIEMCWRPSVVTSGQSFMVSLIGKSLGRGVCEAFMLANGYKAQP